MGKTAVCGYVARRLNEAIRTAGQGAGAVVVAMGRGGPERPEIVDGAQIGLTAADLLRWSREGRHAASDHFEDAVLSRVTTIGCRRCGGGMAGAPFVSNVAEGALLAAGLQPNLVIFEGSGAAMPPVATDVRLLVAGAHQPVAYVDGYLGTYRVLTSDAVVVTMAEEPMATRDKVEAVIAAVKGVKKDIQVVPVVFRPRPTQPVRGRTVAMFTTAPEAQREMLGRYLAERYECRVAMVSTYLSDRAALAADLQRTEMREVDTVLTEIKAAAIDVVAEAAEVRGLDLVFVDNVPEEVAPATAGDLDRVADALSRMACERFAGRS